MCGKTTCSGRNQMECPSFPLAIFGKRAREANGTVVIILIILLEMRNEECQSESIIPFFPNDFPPKQSVFPGYLYVELIDSCMFW